MLVISQKAGDKIKLDSGITISIIEVKGGKVRLGIDAPKDVKITKETSKSKDSQEKDE